MLRSLQKNDEHVATLNGIRIKMYEQAHFTLEEWAALAPAAYKNRRFMFTVPFHDCIQTDVVSFLGRGKEYRELTIQNYLLSLAFVQRCRLPLEYTMNFWTLHQFPLEAMPNFTILSDLFDEHYKKWDPLNENDTEKTVRSKEEIQNLTLRLWLSGYGVIEGIGHEPITDDLLKEVADKFSGVNNGRRKRTFTLLSYLLSKEERSSVRNVMNFSGKKDVFESELELWLEESSVFETELALHIKEYVFGGLKDRVKKVKLQTYTNVEGDSGTIATKEISPGTWKNYSKNLRLLCQNYLYLGEVHTIEDVLQGRLMDIFVDIAEGDSIKNFFMYVQVIDNWFDFYAYQNQLNVNKKRIIPKSGLRTRDKRFGKHIDFKQAVKLIETLQDDQSPYHQDNALFDFRLRRLSLLILETGKRAHEVCYLKQNCLKQNKYGDSFLHFHKTKTRKKHDVKISRNAVEWVKQLQSVAPTEPIEIKSELYPGGDDLRTKRLVAGTQLRVVPLLPVYVTTYLKDLQKKIWKDMPPPSGRYFTAHDLRRMYGTYLKFKGLSNEEIANRLGHKNLESQYTYTLTAGNDILDALQDISKQGLYGIKATINENTVDSVAEEVKVLSEESIFKKSSMIIDEVEEEETAKKFIEQLLKKTEGLDFSSEQSQPDGEVPKGFPMRTHNCNAHAKVTCFHHTLKCYKCNKYSPDEDMLLEHTAELVRWGVFVHHQETLLKKTKDKVEKRTLPLRIDDIKKDLQPETFKELFRKFKHLSEKEAEAVEKEVYQTVKKYIAKYYRKFPSPTAKQMDDFLRSGIING
ncbi:site-specific integrase [Bacillus toyonensis]|uniref:site-specific integrase n=1 Tax=Bacillus toyonensis TaxID=155322 RepID=UPI00211F3805|nr:site-specific integrase [Bacillus toyonensis]